jgi:hypothetical protein
MAVTLDDIRDPEAGLALIESDWPDEGTPEQRQDRRAWIFLLKEWRDGLAGDTLAFMRALLVCHHLGEPPPYGLVMALTSHVANRLSPKERQDHAALARHRARWEAMQAALGEGLSYESARAAASARLFGSDAAGEPRMVRESHELINDAGGKRTSLTSYRRARKRRNSTPK